MIGSTRAQGYEGENDLESGFINPPNSATPGVYWFWVDGNVSREGITADLNAMKRVGIGTVLLMDVSQQIPSGPVRFGSPQWRDMFKHTLTEADRLGLEVNMHNAAGWTGSGGPWITPEFAMQQLVWSKTNVTGPARFEGTLPRLQTVRGYSREIATLAFPTLIGDGAAVPDFAPKITASGVDGLVSDKLLDGKQETFVTLPPPKGKNQQYVQLEFKEPFLASRLILTGTNRKYGVEGGIQVSDDGRKFRDLRSFVWTKPNLSLDFAQVAARTFRIVFTKEHSGAEQIQVAEVQLMPIHRIELHQAKTGLSRGPWPKPNLAPVPPFSVVRRGDIVNLTTELDKEGNLVWDVPKGQWTITRFGYTPMGTENHPVPDEGRGLECDKLSEEAITRHFKAFLGKLIGESGELAGRAFAATHIDSWEVGFQNWTPLFIEEFRRRRGYDPVPYLPTYTGRFVESPEVSERFLWDVRSTIAELLADNYAGGLAELAHQHGLKLSVQAYANGPFNNLLYASRADIPMSEFWTEAEDNSRFHWSREMASVAHTYGKPLVAAESFTAYPECSKWQNHPYSLKPYGDAAFCEGVNRLMFHRYAHQPWLDRKPGMTMGPWGLQYERTETWWEQSKPWHDYLSRCQFLLQQGTFVADICYVTDEGAYTEPPTKEKLKPALPAGYDFDFATPEIVLTRMSITNGHLTLPNGMSYRVLVLPETEFLTPGLVRKVKELVEAGATVIGARPSRSPSLTGYPKCDDEVQQLGQELWDSCDGKALKERKAGNGKIICGKSLEQVLAESHVGPDFQQLSTIPGYQLRYIHRNASSADIYFVANSNAQPVTVECEFRVRTKQPAFWRAESGKIERCAAWRQTENGTVMPLRLDPGGSVFVVFHGPSTGNEPITRVTRDGRPEPFAEISILSNGELALLPSEAGKYELTTASGEIIKADVKDGPKTIDISSDWKLQFPANWGAPAEVKMGKLISWSEHSEPGVKHFSGKATYSKTFQVPADFLSRDQRLYLNLGEVQVIAEVSLNDVDLGILWKPPFEVDVTRAIKAGDNILKVKIVNLWPNRLIGDQQLPEDCRWVVSQTGQEDVVGEWPKWLQEGRPSPSGRFTFTTWKHWKRDSALLKSGLLGPVILRATKSVNLERPRMLRRP